MTPRHMSDCLKLLLKSTVLLMLVFSTSGTNLCTPEKTERDDYVIRNIGIKLCQFKCVEHGQCLSTEYDIETLICRLSRDESNKIKKKEGHVILAENHSHVPTGSCTARMCTFHQRCLETRAGETVCIQDEKQNDPEKSLRHEVDEQETFANSPLHEACRQGALNQVRDIVFQGFVDVDIREEKHGKTPLMVAAQGGHCKIFAFLIRKGANKSEIDNDGKNVLHWACKGGHASMVECVLSLYGVANNIVTMPPYVSAAFKGYTDVMEFLVCTGSNVSKLDIPGNNALHYACSARHMALVKYLVSHCIVDINSRNIHGMTSLMIAASEGLKDMFVSLVRMGAIVSYLDNNGNNILHLASSGRHAEMVKHILSQNLVDINARDKYGKTAAMKAKHYRDNSVYNLLVSRGCPVK